jgi:hypothetical protein
LLNWANVQWSQGSTNQTITLSNGVRARVTIVRDPGTVGIFVSSGGGTPNSPLEDCQGCDSNAFGSAHDLAVVFDPNRTQPIPNIVVSPITITMSFSQPLMNLKFEISDIDFSAGVLPPELTNYRRDQVEVTSNAGNPKLTSKTAGTPTFTIDGNKAIGNCTVNPEPDCNPASDTTAAVPQADNNQDPDSGTVIVDFGGIAVTTVIITYKEAGQAGEPAGRGIGVFGELTPVELMSFTVD